MTTDPNEAAFVETDNVTVRGHVILGSKGLTKREWFAGMALMGLLARDMEDASPEEQIAMWAVNCADAQIAELNKGQKEEQE